MLTENRYVIDPDFTFDILRGLARYGDSAFIAALAEAVIRLPRHNISQALGHRQIACKMWLRDALYDTLGGTFERIWVAGGWYGVLPAMLFDDDRFAIGHITSIDVDPDCRPVAETLNAKALKDGRFTALTADMYALDYGGSNGPDLVINTSCEHIPDMPGWLSLIPKGCKVVLQSNNYFSEPEHINCVESLNAFIAQCGLARIDFQGELDLKKYRRFMLIGER